MKLFRSFAASFSYFSILPVRSSGAAADPDAIALLPVVGVAIGAIAGCGAYAVWLLTHSSVAMAISAWMLSIGLSGAIHVDGFLDCCDGLFAMVPPEKRLEIMRDPHHGTYAVVGMAMLSCVWIWALVQIVPAQLIAVMTIAATFGRAAAVYASLIVRSVATQRVVAPSLLARAIGNITVGCCLGVGIHYHVVGTIAGLIIACAVGIGTGFLASRRLGGLNGDCYGAIVVISEVALLLAVPYLVRLQ